MRESRPVDVSVKPNISRRHFLSLSVAGASFLSFASLGKADGAISFPELPLESSIRFDVLRSGQVIGSHQVRRHGKADQFNVDTTIDISVSVVGLSLFEYHHRGTEEWRKGRLYAYESETQDDDSRFWVKGQAVSDGFEVDGRKGRVLAPADIMVGTYWMPSIIKQPELINPQRGTIKPQKIIRQERVSVSIDGQQLPATRFTVTGVTDGSITYGDDGRWLAATFAKRSSEIIYRLST